MPVLYSLIKLYIFESGLFYKPYWLPWASLASSFFEFCLHFYFKWQSYNKIDKIRPSQLETFPVDCSPVDWWWWWWWWWWKSLDLGLVDRVKTQRLWKGGWWCYLFFCSGEQHPLPFDLNWIIRNISLRKTAHRVIRYPGPSSSKAD